MTLLIYLIKTILISGLLFGYFMLFLRNRSFHGFNRIFLLSIPFISLLLPLFEWKVPTFWNQSISGTPIHLLGVRRGNWEEAFTIYGNEQKSNLLTIEFILTTICLLISMGFFLRLFRSVSHLQKLKKNSPRESLAEATLYYVREKGTPFSFFKSIFWNPEMDPTNEPGQHILRHEILHVCHLHSFDVFFLEMITAVCWFNPCLYGISRELKAIHEYEADEYAANYTDRYTYAGLLLTRASGETLSCTHPFFKNQIKRRINMMTKQKKKAGWYGRLFILPLLLVITTLFSFRFQNLTPKKSIRVVIDAGHGGIFTGSQFQNVLEKDVNLSIAKKIQSLAPSYNVEVIMSREQDVSPGSNDLTASLNYVASLAEKKSADLFISIHINASETGKPGSGFDFYVPQNSNKEYAGSVLLGTTIAEKIKNDYKTSSDLKQRNQGVWVLNKATVPAVLIECGYLDNPADLKFITDEKNQEKIAHDILKGIQEYNLHQDQVNNPSVSLDTALKQVEVQAEFPGGSTEWRKYVISHLKYPEEAIKREIQGTVIVEFIVKRDGKLSEIKATSGPESLRSEAIRTIKESGKWIPAKNNGVIVDSYKTQPLNFVLQKV